MTKRSKRHKKRQVTGNDSQPDRSPETTAEQQPAPLPLDRGDMGALQAMVRSGRVPLSETTRATVDPFLLQTMQSRSASIRDKIRACQVILGVERLNLSHEAQESENVRPEPPTIHVTPDPEYIRWRHQQARKQLRLASEGGGRSQDDQMPSEP